MLINKTTVSVGDAVSFRVITGEEIVGRLTDNGPTSITVTKPIVLVVNMLPNGQAGLQFAPFMVGADEAGSFVIDKSKILAGPLPARKDVADNYLKATSSIVPAAAGSILT